MYIWDNIASNYLKSIDFTPKEDIDQIIKTYSIQQGAAYIQKEYNINLTIKEIIDGINEILKDYYQNIIEPKSGIEELLIKFKNNNIKMCIVTASNKNLVTSALKRCELDHYFSYIITCDSLNTNKEQPDIYRKALTYLETTKEKTIVFEDALHAIKTLKKDGFTVIGINDEHEINQSEIRKIANYYLFDFLDITDFLKEINII
ncbi:MAG: HAD family hydrolase, partial [Erysipelotrichaceae bacterium]